MSNKKCVFNVDKKNVTTQNKKLIDQILNESGVLVRGNNLIVSSCKNSSVFGPGKPLFKKTRSLIMQDSIGDAAKTMSMEEFYEHYRPYKDHITRLNAIESKFHKKETLSPQTEEGRNLTLFTIGSGDRKIFITGGIHAREWLAPNVVSYLIDAIIDDAKNGGEWANLLKDNTYYIIPVVNPDGYIYTYQAQDNRYWRKNRNGEGVDINRNFPVGFGGVGTSDDPTSDIYRGPAPFSEKEAQAVKPIVEGNDFFIHLDIHSFAQAIAGSWAYKEEPAENNADFEEYGKKMVDAMEKKYKYGHGSLDGELGLSSGSFQDYTTSEGALGYTVELPPKEANGLQGFSPDSDLIIPTGDDMLRLLKAISINKNPDAQTTTTTSSGENVKPSDKMDMFGIPKIHEDNTFDIVLKVIVVLLMLYLIFKILVPPKKQKDILKKTKIF